MQQFVVPQFIEVEDKIFGPITTRQFLIFLAAGLIIFGAYRWADFTLFILILAIVGGLALLFALVKINGQTFHYFILNVIQTLKKPSLRIWKKSFTKKELNDWRKQKTEEVAEVIEAKPIKGRHIRDLALIVNTGGFYKPDSF